MSNSVQGTDGQQDDVSKRLSSPVEKEISFAPSEAGDEAHSDPFAVTLDAADDPKNLPKWRKWAIVLILASGAHCTASVAAMVSPIQNKSYEPHIDGFAGCVRSSPRPKGHSVARRRRIGLSRASFPDTRASLEPRGDWSKTACRRKRATLFGHPVVWVVRIPATGPRALASSQHDSASEAVVTRTLHLPCLVPNTLRRTRVQ